MTSEADKIIDLYQRHAQVFDRLRGRSLFEKPWLDRFSDVLPPGGSILDLGCGMGEPVARYLIDSGYKVTGVDTAPAMIDLCRARFLAQEWIVADMRSLALGRRFHGILAWDSFFHLTAEDQRRMFAIFGDHAAPHAALMFTSGPRHGEAIGTFQGEPLYHASLDESDYRALLAEQDFAVVRHIAEDSDCNGHTVWLAQRTLSTSVA